MNKNRTVGWLLVGLLLMLLTACDGSLATPVAAVLTATAESVPAGETPLMVTSTPRPTATPNAVDETISAVADQRNLDEVTFLGLTGEDWLNIILSVLTFLFGYLIVSWLVRVGLRWLVRRTPTEFDDAYLLRIDGPIRYFVLILFAQFSIMRLSFWDADVIKFLNTLFFLLYMAIIFWIVWRLIGFSLAWYQEHSEIKSEEQSDRIAKTLPLIGRILYATLIMIAFIMVLSHFNVNVTALVAALGLAGLALSLAAQDTLNDVINGVLIWIDRPFRIGDRIEIQGEDTWGDVIDIGTRSTRILSRNGLMVIVPNSVIGKSQVINYAYPNPTMRLEVDINLDYDEDLDKVRRVVLEAVRQVEHVMPDPPVEALFLDFGQSTIVFRVRYWIDTYNDTFGTGDRVNNKIMEAFRAAGIKVAVPKQDLAVDLDGDEVDPSSPAIGGSTERHMD